MKATEALAQLGGVATRAQLLEVVGRAEVDRTMRTNELIVVGHGRYALPAVQEALATAHSVSGVLCLTSAALHYRWAVRLPLDRPHVTFPKNRKLGPRHRPKVEPHRLTLHPGDVIGGVVTSKEATLLHCLRSLPPADALAVADSAARAGEHALLRQVARIARGRGAAQVREIAGAASPEAANAFESALRAIARQVEGLRVKPQRLIELQDEWVRPDLVDVDLRIVLEADSFEWHGGRAALRRDARRYNLLVVDGWLVLRFAWEDVMFAEEYVRATLLRLVDGRTKTDCPRCRAA